jgi:hypothetical protein
MESCFFRFGKYVSYTTVFHIKVINLKVTHILCPVPYFFAQVAVFEKLYKSLI